MEEVILKAIGNGETEVNAFANAQFVYDSCTVQHLKNELHGIQDEKVIGLYNVAMESRKSKLVKSIFGRDGKLFFVADYDTPPSQLPDIAQLKSNLDPNAQEIIGGFNKIIPSDRNDSGTTFFFNGSYWLKYRKRIKKDKPDWANHLANAIYEMQDFHETFFHDKEFVQIVKESKNDMWILIRDCGHSLLVMLKDEEYALRVIRAIGEMALRLYQVNSKIKDICLENFAMLPGDHLVCIDEQNFVRYDQKQDSSIGSLGGNMEKWTRSFFLEMVHNVKGQIRPSVKVEDLQTVIYNKMIQAMKK